jgi:hypothetical protein
VAERPWLQGQILALGGEDESIGDDRYAGVRSSKYLLARDSILLSAWPMVWECRLPSGRNYVIRWMIVSG